MNLVRIQVILAVVLGIPAGFVWGAETGPAAAKVAAKMDAEQIRKKLKGRGSVNLDSQSLRDWLQRFARRQEFSLRIHAAAIEQAGIDLDKRITISAQTPTLGESLASALDQVELRYVIADESLVITLALPEEEEEEEEEDPPATFFEALEVALERFIEYAEENAERAETRRELRPLLRVELQFLRAVCAPTPEQQPVIDYESQRSFNAILRKYEKYENTSNPALAEFDPRAALRMELNRLVEQHLSAEQALAYRRECVSRAAAHRQSAILNVLAILDERLLLTFEQRVSLQRSLEANWQDAWCASLESFMYNEDGNLPPIPDRFVVPWLTSKQRKTWQLLPRDTSFSIENTLMGLEELFNDLEAVEMDEGTPAVPEPEERGEAAP